METYMQEAFDIRVKFRSFDCVQEIELTGIAPTCYEQVSELLLEFMNGLSRVAAKPF